MNNFINKKKFNKKKNLNNIKKKKKSKISNTKIKKINFFIKKNIINKYTNFFFKYTKKKIKKVNKKKKSRNYWNFKTKKISFYKKIENDQKKKIYVGKINYIYKYSKPTYQYDFDTTFFSPIKHITQYKRNFIEFFNKEKTFYSKPKLFNKLLDKQFRKCNIKNIIAYSFDKKINKLYSIKKLYNKFVNETAEKKPYSYVKDLSWKERIKFGKKLKKTTFINFFWTVFLKLKSFKKHKKSKIKKKNNIKNYKKKKIYFFKTKKLNLIKFFEFIKKEYKIRFSSKSIKKFFNLYPTPKNIKKIYDQQYKKKFIFFKKFSNKKKNDKIYFYKTKIYKIKKINDWKLIHFTQNNFFKQKNERNLESYLTFIEKKNIKFKNIKIHYPYKKRMNKKKNRKKIKNWHKKKNWIIGFYSQNSFRKRRFKNNSIDQEKRFIIKYLLYKHKYTIRFSPRHRVKANKVKTFSLNNPLWNSFDWFRLIKLIKKKFRKRKKKKITKIKFKKKKIFTVRDAKVNLSKGKITYAKATKKISGVKIKIKSFWIKFRYRKSFTKQFRRWSWYTNYIKQYNKNINFIQNSNIL